MALEERNLRLFESMTARIEKESEYESKRILYLIIAHATQVDALGHVVDYLLEGSPLPPQCLKKLSE